MVAESVLPIDKLQHPSIEAIGPDQRDVVAAVWEQLGFDFRRHPVEPGDRLSTGDRVDHLVLSDEKEVSEPPAFWFCFRDQLYNCVPGTDFGYFYVFQIPFVW